MKGVCITTLVFVAALAGTAPSAFVWQASTTVKPAGSVLSANDEAALHARVLEWWDARERRDHTKMYALFERAYREKVTFAEFLRQNIVRTRFDVAAPRIESMAPDIADRVHVSVSIETRPPRLPEGRVIAEEVWIRQAGEWLRVYEEPVHPFRGRAGSVQQGEGS
jgi:hypothetical protein